MASMEVGLGREVSLTIPEAVDGDGRQDDVERRAVTSLMTEDGAR
jgi:hypothetical protein